MAYYITRRGAMSQAVNTVSALTGDIEGATPGSIKCPPDASAIKQLIISLSASIVAVASAGVVVTIRLKGAGLVQSTQDITVGGIREDTTSTAGAKIVPPIVVDTDIPLKPNGEFNVSASMSGVDPGTPEVAVTAVLG